MSRVPFVSPDVPEFAEIADDLAASVASGVLTKGPHLARFEADVAAATGAAHAVAMSSCTVGLALLMRAMRARYGGDAVEVILPSYMFLAGPAAVVWAGLTPVFVEVDPETWTVCPQAVEAAVSPKTFAILGCHTFGAACAMEGLAAVADRAGVPLLFDAAHGLGTKHRGRQVGAEGLAQVFSLSPTKLVVAGEGGVVTTNDAPLAAALREAREYGNDGHYGCAVPGLNGRMPEACAILGAASLARLAAVRGCRAAAAEAYAAALAPLPGIGFQAIPPEVETSWKDFTITIDPARLGRSRDDVREALAAEGIDTRSYYSPACHRMEAFRAFHAGRPPLAVTDRLAATCLSLPMGRHVGPHDADRIARRIASLSHAAASRASA